MLKVSNERKFKIHCLINCSMLEKLCLETTNVYSKYKKTSQKCLHTLNHTYLKAWCAFLPKRSLPVPEKFQNIHCLNHMHIQLIWKASIIFSIKQENNANILVMLLGSQHSSACTDDFVWSLVRESASQKVFPSLRVAIHYS